MLVFCITCKNRTPHLRETLARNLADNPNSRFVVLDYHSKDDLLEFLSDTFLGEIAKGRLVVYSYAGWPKFRMAHAKNLAHRLGIIEGGDILVNLDADNYAGPDFESFATRQLSSQPRAFLWANMIKGEMTRGIGGRIAVSRKTFTTSGGYDEKFESWASDDKDFNLRLRMMGFKGIEIERQFLECVRHNDRVRFKDYPHLIEASPSEFEINAAEITRAVVNGGNIGCGTVYRNFDRDHLVEVKPIPARIFGVGLSKTGTVSLHQALKLLGYDSWHWSSAHAAKSIWQEMKSEGRSQSLERYEALTDLPIPILYRELDVAYPGSKFILTLRNEEKWLESIRRHFLPEHNPWRSGWDSDPFSHRVHHLTYGRTDFDPEAFLARYRQHNAEVQEYFKHRPNDLVLLHLDKKHGWGKLCHFLDRIEPDVPFPHENAFTPPSTVE